MTKNEWIPMKHGAELHISNELLKQYDGSKFLAYKELDNEKKIFKLKDKNGKIFLATSTKIDLEEIHKQAKP